MELIRATKELFQELEAQWKGQLSGQDESLTEYAPFLDHSHSAIAGEHDDYFVYILTDNGAHHGFLHVNHAQIKRLDGYTLRALEILLAPQYDYAIPSVDQMSSICSAVLSGLLDLSNNALESNNIKIHMGPLDKTYLVAFANFSAKELGIEVSPQGSWLVIKKP